MKSLYYENLYKRNMIIKYISIIIASLLFLFVVSESTKAGNINYEAYCEYYDFIQEKLNSVGYYDPLEIKNTTYAEFERSGLIYTRIIDFDLDGIDQLIKN